MEFLLVSLGVLAYSIVGVIIYGVASAIVTSTIEMFEEVNDYRERSRELRDRDSEIKELKAELKRLNTRKK